MSLDLEQMMQEMMELNVKAHQQALQSSPLMLDGKTLKEVIGELEALNMPSKTGVAMTVAPPPNNYAQADEIIEGPVLQDILERLRRLEKAVAELLVKENNRQNP